jgi:hypothetical protein
MTDEERAVVVEVLCSQALADHLGDVRDAESKLWALLGVPPLPSDHPAREKHEAWPLTKARLQANGIALPPYLGTAADD